MSIDRFVSKYLKQLDDNLVAIEDSLLNGGAGDYAQYKYQVGQIKAWRAARELARETVKKLNESDGFD